MLSPWIEIGRGIVLLLVLASVGSALACSGAGEQASDGGMPGQVGDQQDAIATPPTQQIYFSPNGRYRFEIHNGNRWQTPRATGQLYRLRDNRSELLWQQSLPQEYGPRFVVTGPEGQVLLLDEYINVASAYAILLLSPTGEIRAQYSFDELERVLNVDRAEIVEQAEYGWWISAAPEVDTDSEQVTVATAGKTLTIDLTTGELSW